MTLIGILVIILLLMAIVLGVITMALFFKMWRDL